MNYGLPFLPSILSSSFLGIGSLVFSETLYGIRDPYRDVCYRARFFWKNLFLVKMTKYGQKMPPKMDFFGLFTKIYSLVFFGNGVE